MRQLLFLLLLLGPAAPLFGQPVSARPDPRIEAFTAAVSADTIERSIRTLAAFGTRHTLSDARSATTGIGAARRWIRRTLEGYGGRLRVEADGYRQPPDGRRIDRAVEIVNVLATLPGTDPADDRVFLISGHYDTRVEDVMDSTSFQPGASDDASGTAAVMEIARVLAAARFPATLVFAAVAGEEQGLLGSTHLARKADSLGWNVAGMITLDIVGNTEGGSGAKDNRTIRVFSEGVPAAETAAAARRRASVGGENDSPARQLARYLEEVGERYVPRMDLRLVYRRDRFLRGGDHIPFSDRGFAAVRMSEPNEAFERQHQRVRVENGVAYGDVVERVDFGYVADVARVNLAGLANLALAPPPPDSVRLVVAGLGYGATLRWHPPEAGAGRIAGYYVLVRDTAASRWERRIFVGDRTEHTLDFSVDDYFFGVQSVDAEGHESRIIFPGVGDR